MPHCLNRRELVQAGALLGAGFWMGVAPGAPPQGANERLNLAFVGCGGRGGENLKALAGENVVALCDTDERQAAAAFTEFPRAKRYRDYRRLFDEMERQIDAVVVSTPDHAHAPISLSAMRRGKHVYCEKPLTWSIAEARLMARVAREKKLATQMGTQGMADDGSRAGVEAIRSGVLGPVRHLHVWTDRAKGWWPQGVDRSPQTPAVPRGLDWDLWLNVAPFRPFHPDYVPFKWRGWKDFGTGAIGDMGIHNAAMPFVGLQAGLPSSVDIVATSGLKAETFPTWSILRFRFPARGNRPSLTMHWYDGGKLPPADLIGGKPLAENGAILVGDRGTLYSVEWTGGDWKLFPEALQKEFKKPPQTEPRSPGHHAEWVRACKGGPPAYCNFIDFAAPITEVMLVGALALRTGQRIEWDAEACRAPNCPQAEPIIRRPYRPGWDG